MTVCLSRALKEKERLGTRIQELKQILREENAKETSDERCIDVVDGLRRLKSLKHEICVLKAVIARANQPIVHLLIEMEEWKGLVAVLEAMKKAGVDEVCTRYASNRDCITLKISAAEIREKIASLQSRIYEIQDELDEFNVKTMVDISIHEECPAEEEVR